jgi:hypothetical protein
MTDIPNSSKSPYWLKRSEARGTDDAGDADVRGSEYSLRSIPAWDPNYLGSSLLAKRIRKILALIDDRLNTIAVGGVDNALLEQMIATALAGMNLEGLNQAQVDALIAPVAVELKGLLSNMASIDGSILKPATVEQAVALLKGMYTETVQAAESLNDLVWGLAQKPGGPASVDQAVKAVWDAINALAAEVAAGGGGQLGAGLTPEQLQQIADAVTLAQGVVDIIGGKPQGGATLADVAAVFGDLGATFDAQIAAAIAEIPLGLTEESWTAILEEKLTDLAPMIFQAVQSQMNALPERIRLNVKDASPDAKVVIEALNLTASGPNPNPVSMDIETPGGNLSVNGKRVLTTDDSLSGGSGVIDGGTPFDDDTAPLSAVTSFSKDDLLKLLMGGNVIADRDWAPCPVGGNPPSSGNLQVRMLNGIASFRGEVTITTPIQPGDGWVTVRNLPNDFPVPPARVVSSSLAFQGGSTYLSVGLRVSPNGQIQVFSPDGPAKQITFTGFTYQGF